MTVEVVVRPAPPGPFPPVRSAGRQGFLNRSFLIGRRRLSA
jgi:hypothetical protein